MDEPVRVKKIRDYWNFILLSQRLQHPKKVFKAAIEHDCPPVFQSILLFACEKSYCNTNWENTCFFNSKKKNNIFHQPYNFRLALHTRQAIVTIHLRSKHLLYNPFLRRVVEYECFFNCGLTANASSLFVTAYSSKQICGIGLLPLSL